MSIISKDIQTAAAILRAGDVIGLPTETVYGLAANAFDENAIRKIYQIKNRPAHNPLIVHIGSPLQLKDIVTELPPKALQLAEHFWPGSLTLLLPKQAIISEVVTAGKPTVAVRVPDHPLALALLNSIDFPLVAPSANPSNAISPTTAQHVEAYFKNELKLILDGGVCKNGIESTIIGFADDQPVLYRFGAIPLEDIEAIVGPLRIFNKENNAPSAPGMLLKHYSPSTPFCFTDDVISKIQHSDKRRIGLVRFREPLAVSHHSIVRQAILSPSGSLKEATFKLYSTLIDLDKLNLDLIISERFPDEGLGHTINDRLSRAHNV
jgi:L-threonylcarbamoyladenylate synthase